MKYLNYDTATVKRVRKDLETIVKIQPDTVLSFLHYSGKLDNYISGVRVLKNPWFLLLESSHDKEDALTAEQLLEKIEEYSPIQRVVVQDGWRMVALYHKDCWDYGYDCDEGIVMGLTDEGELLLGSDISDIRLIPGACLKDELERRFADNPGLRVVEENDEEEHHCAHLRPVIDYYSPCDDDADDEGCVYLSLGNDEFHSFGNADDGRGFRVSDLIAKIGDTPGIAVKCPDEGNVLRAIEVDGKGNAFDKTFVYKTSVDHEDIIVFQMGDIIRGEDILLAQEGFYWTSSLYTRRPDSALTIFCNYVKEGIVERDNGLSIRPVTK